MSNPIVHKHMDFYPEDPKGYNIYKLSQSYKWRANFPEDIRVQMVVVRSKHFYVFEPIELASGKIFIPVYFYTYKGELYSKCVMPKTRTTRDDRGLTHNYLTIPHHMPFESADLVAIPCEQFAKIYSEIIMPGGIPCARWCENAIWGAKTGKTTKFPLPNPWHVRANGRIIRHVPITLYADDTSGNRSKQWNKHISYYYTLSGLPPNMTNQNYNCHFLATSNTAGALELADQIVDELNLLATEGFTAFDAGLNQEVLVMTMALCFLGDSPMHAEIANTPMPSISLNPCRMCTLSAPGKDCKSTHEYVNDFLGKDEHGDKVPFVPRRWEETIQNTHALWEIGMTRSKKLFDSQSIEYGVRDVVNRACLMIIKDRKASKTKKAVIRKMHKEKSLKLFNPFLRLKGFDGCKDTPVEILHVFLLGVVKYLLRDFMTTTIKPKHLPQLIASWDSFIVQPLELGQIQGKYFVKHYKSLVGKHFRIVLQVAPFVLFQFMNEDQRELWSAMCELSPLIFQTTILDMELYLKTLQEKLDNFMYLLIMMSAQWVNKPKFHMLLHLPDSIRRFGPASLVATEKFESFNGLLRNASVHSNRHSPGRDLAISFANYECMRALGSGGDLFNYIENRYFRPSPQVTEMFKDRMIQKAMGYNEQLANKSTTIIASYPTKKAPPISIPQYLQDTYPNKTFEVVITLHLDSHTVLKRNTFVQVKSSESSTTKRIARINSMWHVRSPTSSGYVISVTWFKLLGTSEFYKMRIIASTHVMADIFTKDIQATLNVQHNCHEAQCQFKKRERNIANYQEGDPGLSYETIHNNHNSFILNSTSLHAPVNHLYLADLEHYEPTPSQWVGAIQVGLDKWNVGPNKGKGVAAIQDMNPDHAMGGVEQHNTPEPQGSTQSHTWGSNSPGSHRGIGNTNQTTTTTPNLTNVNPNLQIGTNSQSNYASESFTPNYQSRGDLYQQQTPGAILHTSSSQ
ncbi:uncharacterized protein PGTG_15634 [Puccinia graminis f. sp. tritici CRL 75-36-700-3]|uniref:Uncharacterized protein n=1 Tax=Puccinia graminis f. sp. tritici (strain CRL 75-36-700-3 / race SCCL) TaxID=418459 RepID=E3KZE6_PUCGT|nr:uncharacterized protein PGTG_15634 [Puccinia graminis f. sp. tritici CRL 75-36-700-3]EFP89671.2 hypothetical protein PGTG_15634 [Puccinia graminis f. sp. tritici CRL 75-36-700-3]